MKEALGMVEVKGLVAAVAIADTMAKVAQVTIIGLEPARGFGWITVKVVGDVAAVQAACDAAGALAVTMNALVSTKVIPRVSEDVEKVFLQKPEAKSIATEVVEVKITAPISEEPVEEVSVTDTVEVPEEVVKEVAKEPVVTPVIPVEPRRKRTASKAKANSSTTKK